MKPFIPTAVYGVISYILSLTLIASPWLFSLVNISSAALLIPIYMGWLQLIMNIFTNCETGFIKQFPIQMHMVIDVVMGFLLMVSPWLYTFSGHAPAPAPELILGGLLIFLANFTKKSPFLTRAHYPTRPAGIGSTDSLEGRLDI
jgi:hypothetical protein